MSSGVTGFTVVLGISLVAAMATMASETLTSPAHAERHPRRRWHGERWDRFERVMGCALGLIIAALLIAGFVYLLSVKPFESFNP